ncbi:MAG: hypothetical protein ACRBB6_16580 [Neptuniibacter sp.]
MKLTRVLCLLITLTLTACNSSEVKPEAPETEAQKPTESVTSPERKIISRGSKKAVNTSQSSEIEGLKGRLIAIQEQILQLKTQTAGMQQQNQALLLHIQSVKEAIASKASQPQEQNDKEEAPAEDFNGILDQLTLIVNELGNSVQDGPYRITSAYTANGQWVLIRYDRFNGQSWLADQGQWIMLEESGATVTSDYEVVVLRADKDVKGYVASRLDRVNGDTWWLKQNIWQPFVTN